MKKVSKLLKVIGVVLIAGVVILLVFGLNGCSKASRVDWNTRMDADNFRVKRRVIALNTRTNEALFEVEGYISLTTDTDGDLNVIIKTGDDEYKLFYAHLSDDVTYTSVQIDSKKEDPYAYDIQFFPSDEVIRHGLVNVKSTD